jgi:hypothetical protein
MISLLDLPNELLSEIADGLQGKYRNDHLRSLSLVCSRFRDIAQEKLLCEPKFKLGHIHGYLWGLGRHPTLQHKVRRLEIFSSGEGRVVDPFTEYRNSFLIGTGAYNSVKCPPELSQDKFFLRKCSEVINYVYGTKQPSSQPHLAKHVEAWNYALHSDVVAALLGILLAILPNLKELYLGATWLMDFPIFRGILHSEAPSYHPRNWKHSWLNNVFDQLKPRLEILEFPTDFGSFTFGRLTRTPFDFRSFPSLKSLSVPMCSLHWCESFHTPPADPKYIFPPTLELLRISECDEDTTNFMNEVCLAKKKGHLPNLTSVELYFICDLDDIKIGCQNSRCPDPVHEVPKMFRDANMGLYLWFPGIFWYTPEVGGTPWSWAEEGQLNETEVKRYGEPDWTWIGPMEWRWDAQGDVEMLDAYSNRVVVSVPRLPSAREVL